jgi:hypothetical protein
VRRVGVDARDAMAGGGPWWLVVEVSKPSSVLVDLNEIAM